MKYSIIIPVYNVEKYIFTCIESVVNQKIDDYEIIVVDDGTPDNSIKIVESFLPSNKIRIIRQNNQGIAKARAAGIQAAKGTYILFVDSDDYVSNEYLSSIDRHIDGTDILEFSSISFLDGDEADKSHINIVDTDSCILSQDEFRREIVQADIVNGTRSSLVWNKVYRRDLIEKYVTDQSLNMVLEDFGFNCQYYCGVGCYKKITDKLYYYRDRIGSITKKVTPEIVEQLNIAYSIQQTAIDKMNIRTIETDRKTSVWYLNYLLNALQIGFQSKSFDAETIKSILAANLVK